MRGGEGESTSAPLNRPIVQVRPRALNLLQLAQTVPAEIINGALLGGLGRVRAELPVERRPALAPLWFFVLGTWERERMGGLIGGKLGGTQWRFGMKHRAHVLNAAILVLVFAVAVAAQSTEIEQLRLAAEQGDASAQFNLGFMYADGRGVLKDYQRP